MGRAEGDFWYVPAVLVPVMVRYPMGSNRQTYGIDDSSSCSVLKAQNDRI
jgi:hypothetical protein